MTVQDLIDELEQMIDKSLLVVVSRDEEGNGYNELEVIETGYRYEDGEIGLSSLTPELKKQGYTNEDIMEDGSKCIVLYP